MSNNKEHVQKIKAIVDKSNSEKECVEALRKEGLLFSLAEGRRYWNTWSKKPDKKN